MIKHTFNRTHLFILLIFPFTFLYANEGMWMPGQLDESTRRWMKELGLELPTSVIYNEGKPSMKDAIVSFGGFCSGVIVSDEGLVFTNHHCGFDAIQQHSSLENDYLKNGFVAWNRNEELPNPDLFISLLLRTEDVTERVLNAVSPTMSESERMVAVDSMITLIQVENYERDSLLRYIVTPYYDGNEYYLATYKDYSDVRLVYAPPSSVGKFGGDTDNWVWPRHTGDFALFRIYAGTDNEPAAYHPDNIPYRPNYVIPVSLEGYQEGSFCMTVGYPGITHRYVSSFGVNERMKADNMARIEVRGIKQKIWKDAMNLNDSIRIKYASKYAISANYWKNSIGMNQAIQRLNVIGKKEQQEQKLKEWIRKSPDKRSGYLHVVTNLELNYRNRSELAKAFGYFTETFFNSSELIALAYTILNFDFHNDSIDLANDIRKIEEAYKDFDVNLDKQVFIETLENYYNEVDEIYLPEFYQTIENEYNNDYNRFADYIYSSSALTTTKAFNALLSEDPDFNIFDDPAAKLALDLLVTMYDLNAQMQEPALVIEENERLLNAAIREMEEGHIFYPDANSTMRLSVGMIKGYSPENGVYYNHYTTTKGIAEKVRLYTGDPDFNVQSSLLNLLAEKNFGIYSNLENEMNVCFISDNDITGGNSGSGMFNAKGELIGLAFDGNWEAMSSDILFEPNYQRCIGVDIRYALYIIEKYSNARHLIEELQLIHH